MLLCQLLHAGNGHINAQPTIVFAAIAHRVVVAACEHILGPRVGSLGQWMVATHHVAHGIHPDLVKACRSHGPLDAVAASPVCLRQVSYRQLTIFFESRIAELGQVFLPVPHLLTPCGLNACFVVQPDFGNAVNVAQAFLQFKIGVTLQPSFKGLNDLLFVQSQAARSAHGQDKRPAKLGVVGLIQGLNFVKFFWRALCQTCLVLLVARFCCELLSHHGFAGQFGVRSNKRYLGIVSCIF